TIGGALIDLNTRYLYDPYGQLTSVRDANGNSTIAEYDTRGDRISITNPDTGRTDYEYDLAGNLATRQTPNLRALREQIRQQYHFAGLREIDYPRQPPVT